MGNRNHHSTMMKIHTLDNKTLALIPTGLALETPEASHKLDNLHKEWLKDNKHVRNRSIEKRQKLRNF